MPNRGHLKDLMQSVYNRDRTEITPRNYFKKFRRHLFIQCVLSIACAGLLLYTQGANMTTAAISVAIVVIPALLNLRFRNRTRSLVIKGDSLILKSYNKRSLVTSLRSVKKVRTLRLPGMYLTRLEYNLDGRNNRVLVLHRSWAVRATPEKIMRKAINRSWEEKKKKANHKPGSVA